MLSYSLSEMLSKIQDIITARPSVECVHSVQSQWIGPNAFAYKAEVEIDGTYLAAKLLNRYQQEFLTLYTKAANINVQVDQDSDAEKKAEGAMVVPKAPQPTTAHATEEVRLLLSWYAEDIMRTVEREVKDIEGSIRREFPAAQYIEIEPDSSLAESARDEALSAATSTGRNKVRYAIDDARNIVAMRRLEIDTINQMEQQIRSHDGV